MIYDSLIFDLDGTLWNTIPTCTNAWNEGLKALSIQKRVSENDLKEVVGQPWNKCAETLFPDLINIHPNLFKTLDSFERDAINHYGGTLYAGVRDGLRKLSKKYKLFLISNCQDWYLNEFLKFTHLKGHFADFNCFGTSNKSKSTMLVDVIQKYKLNKPVYIGDTNGDRLAAEKAKIDFLQAAWGYGDIPIEYDSFNTFRDLIDYLLDVPSK